jgi:polyisoprenoid-binding protein YceI
MSKSKVTIAGTSTLHDWKSEVNKVWGNATIDMNDGALTAITKLTVDMDVNSIKSEHGNMMDNNTHNALKGKDFPRISFVLTSVGGVKKVGEGYAVTATGNLTLAGQTRPMTMTVTGKTTGENAIEFSGSKSFKMSEFKIDPPVFMMGTLKTGDEVTIKFSVTYSK